MIYNKNCDILDSPAQIIAHVANCQNIMGAGVAAYLKSKYPEIYEADSNAALSQENKLGKISYCLTDDGKFLVNLYAQKHIGIDERQLNYEAFYRCLYQLHHLACKQINNVAIPYKMGCGLAGGNWDICMSMINVFFKDSSVKLYICKKDQNE